LRFVTAASLFDGHDAAINIMRRLIQAKARKWCTWATTARSKTWCAPPAGRRRRHRAVSYQGGHVEYFKYMVDMLRERGAGHIRVFGGGGGTITPEEIRELQKPTAWSASTTRTTACTWAWWR
jgi:methylmalonyl-CoA mutase